MTNIEFLKEHIEQLKEVFFDDNLQPVLAESVELELKHWISILKELKEKENIEYELGVYKLAFEWACNRIEGNPYYEILEEAKKNREAWKKINAGERVGISDD